MTADLIVAILLKALRYPRCVATPVDWGRVLNADLDALNRAFANGH